MKNTYMSAWQWVTKGPMRLLLLLLLALPSFVQAQITVAPTATNASPDNYGSVAVGSTSAARQYTVSASNVNGNIAVTFANSPSFEGSLNATTGFTSALTLPSNGGTIYVRFRPTFVGVTPASGSATNERFRLTGESVDDPDQTLGATVYVKGTGTAGSPAITVSPEALVAFANTEVGAMSAPKTFTVNATSLGTTPITVTAPANFLVSNGGAYANSVEITPDVNGSVTGQIVNVVFKPTSAGNKLGLVTLTSSTASASVSVSGMGVLPTPTLTATPATLTDFGSAMVGTSGPVRSFTVNGQNLQGNVTITPPTGFSIRIGSSFFTTGPLTLTPSNGTLANTVIDVRFNPTAVQSYASDITIGSLNATTQQVRVTGVGTPSSGSPVVRVDPGAIDFGTVTGSGSTSTRSFEISGTDLTGPIVLTPTSNNIEIRNASAGGSFTKTLTINRVGGTVAAQNIEVRLVAVIAQGPFNQNINITSQGFTGTLVNVTANNISGATSDISVVNADNNAFTFATRPNTVSTSQRYLVSGTNLVQPLVIQAVGPSAEYFEVSKDNTNFFPSVSFTPTGPNGTGNVAQQSVYVRFKPGVQAITVTSTIRNSSAPAPDFDVSVTGISEPTIRLDQPIGNFATNVVKGTKTAPKSIRLEGFLLSGVVDLQFPPDDADALRNPTQIPQYEFSLDNGATYVKQASITPDAQGNFTSNILVRYAPTRVGNAEQSMRFRNASLNANEFFTLTSGFGRAQGFSIAVEPTAQSTARVVRSSDGTSATIIFDLENPPAGTTFGVNRLVIGSSTYTTQLPTSLFPVDKQNFNPGTTQEVGGAYNYGTGSLIEANTNTYVVFSGGSSSFTVTGLNPALTYSFFGFEFNSDGVLNAENYRVPNNQPQFPLPVDLVSFTAKLRNNKVALNWVTASEKNNASFAVERSQDGRTFTTVLTRGGKGTTNTRTTYDAVDDKPLAGASYYRLKQVDFDGTAKYSSPVAVTNLAATEISMYPNPTDDVLNIQIGGSTEGVRALVSDLTGRVVLTQVLNSNGQLNLGGLRSGTYLVTVGEGNAKVTRRIVKK
jgi:hypothetical protein